MAFITTPKGQSTRARNLNSRVSRSLLFLVRSFYSGDWNNVSSAKCLCIIQMANTEASRAICANGARKNWERKQNRVIGLNVSEYPFCAIKIIEQTA